MSKATELFNELDSAFPEKEWLTQSAMTTEPVPGDPSGAPKQEPQEVPGGVVFKRDLTPKEYNDQVARMKHLTKINNKRWNSVLSIHQPIGKNDVFHLFHLYFSKEDFSAGATNPEKAERIKYIGQFNSKQAALDFLKSSATPGSDFSREKSVSIGGGKANWTGKELGTGTVTQTEEP